MRVWRACGCPPGAALCCAALCSAVQLGSWAHRSRATCRAAGVFSQHAVVTQVTPQIQLQPGVIVQVLNVRTNVLHKSGRCGSTLRCFKGAVGRRGRAERAACCDGCLAELASCSCPSQASEPAPLARERWSATMQGAQLAMITSQRTLSWAGAHKSRKYKKMAGTHRGVVVGAIVGRGRGPAQAAAAATAEELSQPSI